MDKGAQRRGHTVKVQGKGWVVTGVGSGMCRDLVVALLQRGARVAAVGVRGDALAAVSYTHLDVYKRQG